MNNLQLIGGSIVVLIDCWGEIHPITAHNIQNQQKLYDNILKEIPKILNLTAVVLSTYHTTEHNNSSNQYYMQSADLFYNAQPIAYVREMYQQLNYEIINSAANQVTDPKILNKLWQVPQLAMTHPYQLEYYINHVVPHVKNIFFFGQAWNLCVKKRPIGYSPILELIKWNHLAADTRVFTFSNCILALDIQTRCTYFPELTNDTNCVKLSDNLFEII